MPEKHIPLRMCIVTRQMLPKSELIRIVKTDNGLIIDKTQKKSGLGFWISKDKEVINQAKKRKALNKILKGEVKSEFYEELEKCLDE